MRVFEHPNMVNFVCPICNTNDDKPIVLIAVDGTEDDGIVEAKQYHLDCIQLTEIKMDTGNMNLLFQIVDVRE